MIEFYKSGRFETPVDSLDELDEGEFEVLFEVLRWGEDGEGLEQYVDEPEDWIKEWIKHLQIASIYSTNVHEMGWSGLNWIGDLRSKEYWFFIEYNDGCFLYTKIDTPDGILTKDAIWPHLLKHLEMCSDYIYCDLSVNPEWVGKEEIGNYFRGYLKNQGTDRFDNGDGPTVDEWLEEQYRGED